MFGQEYAMRIEGDGDSLVSILGTVCSLILMLITGLYAYTKLNVLLDKKDTNILTMSYDLHFTDSDQFGYE